MKRHIGCMIKIINDKIKVNADSDLKKHCLTLAQSRVITFLSKNGGMSAQKEIERFLDISHPTVVGIISRMEKNGFVTSMPDPKDKRNKMVLLTEKATNARNEIFKDIEKTEAKMTAGLSEEETENLYRMLETIYKNIE